MSINHKNIILTALVCAALSGSAAVALAAADASEIDAAESVARPQVNVNLHELPLHWDSVEHPLQNKATAKQAKAMPIIITADDVKKAEKAAAQRARDEKKQVAKPVAPPPAPSVAPQPVAPPPVAQAPTPQSVTPPLAPPTIAPPQDNWVTPKAPVAPPPAEQIASVQPSVQTVQPVQPAQPTTPTQSLEIVPLEPQVATAPPVAPSVELPAIMPLASAPAVAPKKEIIVELPEIMPLTAEQLAAPQIVQPVPPKTIKKTVELPPVELFGTSRTVEIEVEAVEPEQAATVDMTATEATNTVELQLQPLN